MSSPSMAMLNGLEDSMALTLNGSTRWPTSKELQRLGETLSGGTPSQIKNILDCIVEAIHSTSTDVRVYMKEHPDFTNIGGRMLQEWEKGLALAQKLA